MMKIKDCTALGTFCGTIASLPQAAVDYLIHLINIPNHPYHAFQIAAGIYLRKNLTLTPQGVIFGGVVWIINAAVLGVIIAWYIRKTGEDYWWVKGLALTLGIMYISVYGFVFNMGGSQIIPTDLGTNLSMLINNTVYGIICPWLIVRLGDHNKIESK